MPKKSSVSYTLLACATLFASPARAAVFDVTHNQWGDETTINSFAWAIHQSNITAGLDTINLFTNVSVDLASPLPNTANLLARITDPSGLAINGGGFTLSGNPSFISSLGYLVTKNNPQEYVKGISFLTGNSFSFAQIDDNVSDVTINGLVVDGLHKFLSVGKNAVASVIDTTIKNSVNYGHNAEPIISVFENSVLNMTRVAMSNINTFRKPDTGQEFNWLSPIAGLNASLNVLSSSLDLRISQTAGALTWRGGTANIVSSQILGQGLSIEDHAGQDGVLNLVNSVFRPEGNAASARLQALNNGEAKVIASTLQFDAYDTTIPSSFDCPDSYKCNGIPLTAVAGGSIHLRSSAVSALILGSDRLDFPYSNTWQTYFGTMSADPYSYVMPVAKQDGASLKSLFSQPSLITTGNPYPLSTDDPYRDHYVDLPKGAYPLLSGPLIAGVPDADTTNQLINPIDGSVITTDVYGNPRTANGLRDIGAVQASVPGPLPVLGCGVAFGWSRRLRRRIQRGRSSVMPAPATEPV